MLGHGRGALPRAGARFPGQQSIFLCRSWCIDAPRATSRCGQVAHSCLSRGVPATARGRCGRGSRASLPPLCECGEPTRGGERGWDRRRERARGSNVGGRTRTRGCARSANERDPVPAFLSGGGGDRRGRSRRRRREPERRGRRLPRCGGGHGGRRLAAKPVALAVELIHAADPAALNAPSPSGLPSVLPRPPPPRHAPLLRLFGPWGPPCERRRRNRRGRGEGARQWCFARVHHVRRLPRASAGSDRPRP